jgi:hypothetical protein
MTRARTVIFIGILIIICLLFQWGVEGFQVEEPCSALSLDNLSGVLGTYTVMKNEYCGMKYKTGPDDPINLTPGTLKTLNRGPYENIGPEENKLYTTYGRSTFLYVSYTSREGCQVGKFIQELATKYGNVILTFRGIGVNAKFQIVISPTSTFATFIGDPKNYLVVYNPDPLRAGVIYQGDSYPIEGSTLELVYRVEGGNDPPENTTPVPTTGTSVTVPVTVTPETIPTTTSVSPPTTVSLPTTVSPPTTVSTVTTSKKWYETPMYAIPAAIAGVTTILYIGSASVRAPVQSSTRPNMRGNA